MISPKSSPEKSLQGINTLSLPAQLLMKKNILLATLSTLLFLSSCKKEGTQNPNPTPTPNPNPTPVQDNDPLLFGNPTNAQNNATYLNNYLKDNSYYKLAYSSSRNIPVWVGWHLQSEDLGSTPRQNDFRADQMPSGWFIVQSSSYSNSGFDRGHNCPSADRTSSIAANSSTFLMTNMIPQAPKLNQGPWGNMEDFIRTLVGTTKEAYIFMGNYGMGGVGTNGPATDISGGNIIVPQNVFKIAVIIPKNSNDLARIDTTAIVFAVNMPNDNNLYSTTSTGQLQWKNYITTINDIEQAAAAQGLTLNFLGSVSTTVRSYLKQKRYY
jgi:endonuclease G, mitochondrial